MLLNNILYLDTLKINFQRKHFKEKDVEKFKQIQIACHQTIIPNCLNIIIRKHLKRSHATKYFNVLDKVCNNSTKISQITT